MYKTKVLICIDWFLPGTNSGGPVRSVANMVEHLVDIEFYILTRNTDYCSTEPYKDIPSDTWVRHSANVHVYYFSDWGLTRTNLEREILETRAKTVYVNGVYSKLFSQIPISIAKKHKLRCIVAPRGMLSLHSIRVKAFKKRTFLFLNKIMGTYKNIDFHLTSAQERKEFKQFIEQFSKDYLIQNLPRKISFAPTIVLEKEEGKIKLIYLGRIAKEKGTLKAIHYLSQTQKGEFLLDIYGSCYDKSYWKTCLEAIDVLPLRIEVNYKGTLSAAEILPVLQKYHYLYLPSEGENFGHSILESLQAGRPAIIRNNTPWKNLEFQGIGFDCEEEELPKFLEIACDQNQDEFNLAVQKTGSFIQKQNDISETISAYYEMFQTKIK